MSDAGMFFAIFCGVWFVIGVVFLAVGLGLRRSWTHREDNLRGRAEGTVLEVIRHESHTSDGTSVSWCPLVEFDFEGRRISLETKESVSRKKYYEGQRVNVLYDPDDPSAFRIEGETGGRTVYRVFTAVGAGCLAMALIAAAVGVFTDPEIRWMMKYRWFR